MSRAHFIVIEGIDGAGTTTQAQALAAWMNGRGQPALATHEPSAGPIGQLLRQILRGDHAPFDGTAMALLFAADRMDHLAREIEPALAAGTSVVSDRYYHSSFAYQGEEAERGYVEMLNGRARVPDLTLLLALPAEQAAQRRERAGRPQERYDALALQQRIADNYRALAERLAARERIIVIDAAPSIDAVQHELRHHVESLCP